MSTPAGPEPAYSAVDLRDALSQVPTPVTVITVHDDLGPHGTTVSAFCSLSAEPPLVLVALDRGSNLLRKLRLTSRFGVSVLATGQDDIALRCAGKSADKFAAVPWCMDGDVPRIEGAACWFRCDAEGLLPGGDHEVVVGRVQDCSTSDRHPLVYHRRAFKIPHPRPTSPGDTSHN